MYRKRAGVIISGIIFLVKLHFSFRNLITDVVIGLISVKSMKSDGTLYRNNKLNSQQSVSVIKYCITLFEAQMQIA